MILNFISPSLWRGGGGEAESRACASKKSGYVYTLARKP